MPNPAPDIPVSIPWGKETFSMRLPDRWKLLGVMEPSPVAAPQNVHREIERSLSAPIGLPRLAEIAKPGMKIALVIDDDSRPTPVALILPSVLAELRSPANVLMVFFTSVAIWLLETVKYWFVMHAFGFSVSFFTLMLMNGVVNLATTIPAAPGYLGTFDAPGIAVLTADGVNKAIATGYTLVLHLALWVPITALGAYFLAREGIKWSEALRKETQT